MLRHLLVALALAACAPAPRAATTPAPAPAPAPTAPAFQLVETAPLETALDHPEIPEAAEVWLAMIRGARRSIDLAQFYASNHEPSRLEPIVAALADASARGVRVRFLVEQGFVKVYPDTLDRLGTAGAQIRAIDFKHLEGGGGILHAKYFLVDDREAFFGSQNFDWRALEHNYELGARTTLPHIVGGLAAIFAGDWARAGGEPPPTLQVPPPTGGIALVASPPKLLPGGVDWDLPRLVALLDSAKTSISVEALGYLAGDWNELEAPLKRAAARGVDVQLLLADWSKRDKTIGGLQALARVPHITVKLTTIPAWSGGFIPFARVSHAKALIVDGNRGWLGTSNWEKDYFYRTRNVGVTIDDPAVAAQLSAFFATLWQQPYAILVDPKATYAPPRIE